MRAAHRLPENTTEEEAEEEEGAMTSSRDARASWQQKSTLLLQKIKLEAKR